ncbi:MAG: hypothetical protein MZV49_23995 [Rhodopseudomonas palustris]|nr:hypothetical protein [Rhodopseudomonas palustris]
MKLVLGNEPPSLSSLDLGNPNPTAGSIVTIVATATDQNGDSLSYTWILTAAPLGYRGGVASSGATATFTPDRKGSYTVRCTVSDGADTAALSIDIAVLSSDAVPPVVLSTYPTADATDVADVGEPGLSVARIWRLPRSAPPPSSSSSARPRYRAP